MEDAKEVKLLVSIKMLAPFVNMACVCVLPLFTNHSLPIGQFNMVQARTGSSAFHLIRHLLADRYSESLTTELDWTVSLLCT